MFNGDEWDSRIQVPLDLDNDLLLQLAMEAHKRDITLNKMVEIVLQQAIDTHKGISNE
jgi:predicted HicB family RNase H-like nuclease